jgi:hypothetical protein
MSNTFELGAVNRPIEDLFRGQIAKVDPRLPLRSY